jgi:hypothetical protein
MGVVPVRGEPIKPCKIPFDKLRANGSRDNLTLSSYCISSVGFFYPLENSIREVIMRKTKRRVENGFLLCLVYYRFRNISKNAKIAMTTAMRNIVKGPGTGLILSGAKMYIAEPTTKFTRKNVFI